ncbi:MAG: hypothetical protein JXR76_01885 [Deltaproteobacteria bacterium]|nr:hypothetical protein [Deltaproteobacteria bacterium]
MKISRPYIRDILRAYYRTMHSLYFEELVDTQRFLISFNAIADRKYYNCAHTLASDDRDTLGEIEQFFEQRGTASCVYVDPCSPLALEDSLKDCGYKEDASELEVWYQKKLDSNKLMETESHIKIDAGRLHIQNVHPNSPDMHVFWEIDTACNDITDALGAFFRKRAHALKIDNKNEHSFFLGRLDGIPVMTGAVSVCGPFAFFSEAAVLTPYRCQGLYSTMLMHCINFSTKLGCSHAFVNCDGDAFSNQACLKTGFNAFFRRRLFRRPLTKDI